MAGRDGYPASNKIDIILYGNRDNDFASSEDRKAFLVTGRLELFGKIYENT